MVSTYIWLAVVAVAAIYGVVIYNGLVNLKHGIGKAWSNIDILLVQRHSELPKLVETCKGAGSGSRLSRSPRRINLAEVFRAVEESEAFTTPSRKPNSDCPVGHCIREALDRVFASAQGAMEKDLARTSLGDVIDAVKASCAEKK